MPGQISSSGVKRSGAKAPVRKGIRIAMRERLVPTDDPAQSGVKRRLDSSADGFLDECADLCLFGRCQLL